MSFINTDRSCGECTMCCQGHLSGSAHGFTFGPGKSCYWIRDSGCSIYPYRPENPCKTFKCEYKVNKEIPENFRPDRCNAIFVHRTLEDGTKRLDVVEAGKPLSDEILHFIMVLFNNHKYNYIHYQRNKEWFDLKK